MITSLTVEVLKRSNDPEYIEFLDNLGKTHPAVLCYHYPLYREMLTDIGVGEPFYLGARLNTELVAVLPGFLRSTKLGTVYCSLPFFGPNAGVICSEDEHAGECHGTLLNAVLEYLRSQKRMLSATIYTPFLFNQFEYYDINLPDAIVVNKSTQYLFLPNFKPSSSISYDIRKARKTSVTISTEITPQNVDTFYAIYKNNCRDYGIPLKPRKAIDSIIDASDSPNYVQFYFAFYESTMISGLLVLFSPLTISYYIPCTLHSARNLQAGTMLIDRAIKDAQRRGIQYWNWESSPSQDSGVYKFKKKWGSKGSEYKIYVFPFETEDTFRRIGREQLSENFPHFFTYPFDRL